MRLLLATIRNCFSVAECKAYVRQGSFRHLLVTATLQWRYALQKSRLRKFQFFGSYKFSTEKITGAQNYDFS